MELKEKNKLELVRLEGIRNLIKEKIKKDELSEICRNQLKLESKDYFELLKKLNRYQLINIIELSNKISSIDINNVYEQFRYGLKPGFTIFSFNNYKELELGEKILELNIKEKLEKYNYISDAKYKNLKLKFVQLILDDTYEISFDYLSKYLYISEADEPNFIYELKDSFAWINTKDKFVAVKNCPGDIQKRIIEVIELVFNIKLYNIKITKKLITEIFGNDIKKGTFVKPNANEDEVAKIMISDDKLASKTIYRDSVSSYDMSSTFLNEKIDENTNSTLGINCNSGKIYLTRNVNATQFRNWSINCLNNITSYLNNVQNCKEKDIFDSKNIMAKSNYDNVSKKIIEEICYKIFLNINNTEDSFHIENKIEDLYAILNKNFYFELFGHCIICDEDTQLFCSKCLRNDLTITKTGLICKNCGINVENLECDEGHQIYCNNISDFLKLIPTKDFLNEINEILYSNFNIRFEGSFYIEHNQLVITKYSEGNLISVDDIKEFEKINTIALDDHILLDKYSKIKEKCKKCGNDACSLCVPSKDNICIMNLFIGFGNYRPSPHQGLEFGDVNFEITFKDGVKYNFVGVAKSRTKTGVLNRADREGREMLQQILTMSRDKNVEAIGAICPSRFHEQLVQELKYLAKITNTKIVILDDLFMEKLLKYKNIVII